jgi:hypothetical protein
LLRKPRETGNRPVAARSIEYEHQIVARTCRPTRWDIEVPAVPVCVRISWLIPGPPVFVVNARRPFFPNSAASPHQKGELLTYTAKSGSASLTVKLRPEAYSPGRRKPEPAH